MKLSIIFITIALLASLVLSGNLSANEWSTTGIGLRGSYWNVVEGTNHIQVKNYGEYTEVNVGGYGGSIYFFSRAYKQLFLEISLGAIGAVESKEENYYQGGDVDASAVIPVLFGIRYDLLPLESNSALQPYAAFGLGVYWLSDVTVRNKDLVDEEVTVDSASRPGAYAGFGLNFLLTRKFGFNFDLKHHFVDFQRERYNSGFEFAFGLIYMWGKYKG
jgi:outer membrane protein W